MNGHKLLSEKKYQISIKMKITLAKTKYSKLFLILSRISGIYNGTTLVKVFSTSFPIGCLVNCDRLI